MRRFIRLACTGALMLCAASPAIADTITFELIPNALSANDMTPDGRYIVGETPEFVPYIYDSMTQVMTLLPAASSQATAVSDDGEVVFGQIADPGTGDPVAALWTRATGVWTSIGYLPNAGACPSRSSPYELSTDGSVAVGLSWDGCSGRAFRWTQSTGMVELEPLANGGNRASVCSADGNVIGGFAQGSFSRTPAVWDGNGNGILLDAPNGDALGEIYAISDDGSTLLGNWDGKASRWTYPALERTQIAGGSILPNWSGIPQDIADDETIVGFDFLFGSRRAWIQLAGEGPMIDLETYIEANGAVVPSGIVLEVCQAISNDGTKLIGHSSASGAWLITITHELVCPADLAPGEGDGKVDVTDLFTLLAAWNTNGPGADLAPPTDVVNTSDLFQLLAVWGSCAPTGACCVNDECSQMTEAACASAGGEYIGNNVPCSVDTCVNNDLCADAIDLTDRINNGVVLGSNSLATPSFGGGDTELPTGSPSCQWSQTPNAAHSTVWYTFTAPANGNVTIALCGSEAPINDTIMALYTGACGSLSEVACDEDGCNGQAPWYSRIDTSGLTPGATYYLCVMNTGGWTGSVPGPFELIITSR